MNKSDRLVPQKRIECPDGDPIHRDSYYMTKVAFQLLGKDELFKKMILR